MPEGENSYQQSSITISTEQGVPTVTLPWVGMERKGQDILPRLAQGGRGCTSSVLLQPTLVLLVFFFFLFIVNHEGKDERKSYLRRQLSHLSVQIHQHSIKVTLLANRAAD